MIPFIPKYGIKGTTYSVVGNTWLFPALVAFFVSLPFLGIHRTAAELGIF